MITWVKKRWNKGKMIQDIRSGIALSLAMCFMIFLFAPFEMYVSNPGEFWYDAYMLFPFLIKDFLLFFVLSIVGFFVAYLLGDFIYTASLYGYFVAFIGCYVQGNFLIKGLPPFDGTEVVWSQYRTEHIKCALVWLILAILILAILILLKKKKFYKVVTYTGVFFFLVLLCTLMAIGIPGGLFQPKQYARFTKNDQFEMSTDTNFIILLLDAIDEQCFAKVWEKHPEYTDIMEDFTFYDDVLTGYAYTDHALPLMVSGEWFENKEPYKDYLLRIYRNSPLFNQLEEDGYSLSFYDDELKFEVGEMDGEFANMTYTKSTLWDPDLFNKRIIKMVGVKYAPYSLKPYCWFDPDWIKYQEMGSDNEQLFSWKNGEFYQDVISEDVTFTDGKKFKLIHLMGAHVPFLYDKDMNETEDADYFTCIESSMTVTAAYLNKLKEAGVYDNSIIMVLSDHGYNTSGDAAKIPQRDENQYGRQHPIMFIKGLNERHPMKISKAPISYGDLMPAYDKLLKGASSDDCFEYKEGDKRERRYMLYKYLGEDHIVEYVQTGYAGDESTLLPTGRVFDAE